MNSTSNGFLFKNCYGYCSVFGNNLQGSSHRLKAVGGAYDKRKDLFMKKIEGYRIRKLEDEYVVLPFGKRAEEVNEVISLSETAGFMYLHAEEADSAEELAELVSKAYEVEKSVVYEDVVSVVRTLKEKGLLL